MKKIEMKDLLELLNKVNVKEEGLKGHLSRKSLRHNFLDKCLSLLEPFTIKNVYHLYMALPIQTFLIF